MHTFIEGLLAGFAYVMPIGAQNIYLIHTSINARRPYNFVAAFYVMIADLSLALICFFGVGHLLSNSFFIRIILSLFEALVLFTLGYKLITSTSERSFKDVRPAERQYLRQAFLVTYANPQAIVDGAFIYGALRATNSGSEIYTFFSGNIAASLIWFGGITTILSLFRSTDVLRNFYWVERLCGILMILIGSKIVWVTFRSVYEL